MAASRGPDLYRSGASLMKIARSSGRNALDWDVDSESAIQNIQPALRPGISLLLSASLVLSGLSLEGCHKEAAKPACLGEQA